MAPSMPNAVLERIYVCEIDYGCGKKYHCKLLTSGVELGEMWNAGNGLIPSAVAKVVAYKYLRSLVLISSTLSSSNPIRDRDRSPEVKILSGGNNAYSNNPNKKNKVK